MGRGTARRRAMVPTGSSTFTSLFSGFSPGRAGDGRPDRAGPASEPRATEWTVVRRLYVDPSARGKGIGTALLAEQLRRQASRGARRFLLHIPEAPDDAPAHGLYLKFGGVADVQQ